MDRWMGVDPPSALSQANSWRGGGVNRSQLRRIHKCRYLHQSEECIAECHFVSLFARDREFARSNFHSEQRVCFKVLRKEVSAQNKMANRNRDSMEIRNQILFAAVKKCKVLLIEEMLSEGNLNLDAREPNSNLTFLQVNAVHGNCTITQQLVRAGCKINDTDNYGNTALHLAIKYDQLKVANQLIRLGADIHSKDCSGDMPLHATIIPMMARTKSKRTGSKAVHRFRLVRMLLDAGAKVNAKNTDGCAPIHYAASNGNLELVKILIKAGADVNVQCKIGRTALYNAIDSCDEALVLLLLNKGASVDVKTESGCTPLNWAAQVNNNNSHESIVRKLLDFGSDVNCVTEDGWTPFHDMIMRCSFDTLSFCIDKVDMKQQSLAVRSLLHGVAYNEDQNVMNLVLDRGIPVDLKDDEDGDTPLILACNKIRTDYVRQLIARGADVNAKNKFGATPLLVSVICAISIDAESQPKLAEESKKVIKLLLEAGCDLNQKIIYRGEQTVLEVLIEQKELVLIEPADMIVQHAVKVEVKTGKPVLDEYNLAVINADPDLMCHYARCRTELEAMKNRKIQDTLVTYFSVLAEPLEVVARYGRNEEIVKEFEASDYQTAYPIYGSQLKDKFQEAMCRRDRKEKVLTVLSDTMQFADPSSAIFETIFKYLRQVDVDLIISSAADIEN